MSKGRMIPLMIVMLMLAGCTQPVTDEGPSSVPVEVSLEPMLIPGKNQPEIIRTDEGVRFQWPATRWVLFEDDTGYLVMDMEGTQYLSLDPVRLQLALEEMPLDAMTIVEGFPAKEGILLTVQNQQGAYGLGHLNEVATGRLEWLIQEESQPPVYLLSEDGSKVVYMHPSEGVLSTYHTITGRRTSINALTVEGLSEDWIGQIRLSPLGGYLSFDQLDPNSGRPIQFIIYGADSGRLIRDSLPGLKPRWSWDDQQVVFLLNNTRQQGTDMPAEGLVMENQLGTYTLRSSQVDFLNRFPDHMALTAPAMFSKDNQYLVYVVTNGENHKLVTHNLNQRVQQSFSLPEGTAVVSGEHWASMDEELLVTVLEDPTGYHLLVYHLTTDYTEIIHGIQMWTDRAGDEQWFHHQSGARLWYMKDGWIMDSANGNHNPMVKLPAGMEQMSLQSSVDWLLVTIHRGRGDQVLYFLPL